MVFQLGRTRNFLSLFLIVRFLCRNADKVMDRPEVLSTATYSHNATGRMQTYDLKENWTVLVWNYKNVACLRMKCHSRSRLPGCELLWIPLEAPHSPASSWYICKQDSRVQTAFSQGRYNLGARWWNNRKNCGLRMAHRGTPLTSRHLIFQQPWSVGCYKQLYLLESVATDAKVFLFGHQQLS